MSIENRLFSEKIKKSLFKRHKICYNAGSFRKGEEVRSLHKRTQRESNPFPYTDSNKRYYTYDYYMKQKFGGKCVRIPLDAGFSCPNIDGRCGTGGCIYCSPAEAVTLRSFRPYPSPSSSQRRAPSCQTSGIPHGVSPISRRIPTPTRLCRCFVKNTRKPWRNPALSA